MQAVHSATALQRLYMLLSLSCIESMIWYACNLGHYKFTSFDGTISYIDLSYQAIDMNTQRCNDHELAMLLVYEMIRYPSYVCHFLTRPQRQLAGPDSYDASSAAS